MNAAKGLFKKALGKDHEDRPVPQPGQRAQGSAVSQQDVYKYRFQYGTNLGSIFVLEKWLFSGMFEKSAEGGSELDAVKASLQARGLQTTVEKWEKHWTNALLDKDIDFLINEACCNTIRLPIGYFTLGPEFCSGTPFQGEPSQVYRNAWQHVLHTCNKLAGVGIGVLIDMHALPGGANKDSHSGTSSPTAGLWGDKRNLSLAQQSLVFVAKEISEGKIPNCTGLQLCNEAAWGAKGMYEFYGSVLAEISRIDSSIPLYISDAWKLDTALEWTRKQNNISSNTNLIIIDTHKYYTFDEKHKSKSPQEIIRIVPEALTACNHTTGNVHQNGAAPVFIGEYSCVMDTRSWNRVSESEKEGLTQQFGMAQCQQWYAQSCGSAFWTLKMAWMPGGGWGFVAQTRKGSVRPPAYLTLPWDEISRRIDEASAHKEQIRPHEIQAHCNYWDSQDSGKRYEHWRFEAGWDDGWNDALSFFSARKGSGIPSGKGGDRIGCLDGWIRKRMIEVGQSGSLGWEYEHGFRNAVANAEGVLLR